MWICYCSARNFSVTRVNRKIVIVRFNVLIILILKVLTDCSLSFQKLGFMELSSAGRTLLGWPSGCCPACASLCIVLCLSGV